MYITSATIINILNVLGISTKLGLDAVQLKFIGEFMQTNFTRYSNYQKIFRKFITKIKHHFNQSTVHTVTEQMLAQYIKTYCVADLRIFYLYDQSDIKKSFMAKYLQKFTNQDLESIFKNMAAVNMYMDMPYYFKNHNIGKYLQKILNYHMLFNFVKELPFIEHAVKHGIFKFMDNYTFNILQSKIVYHFKIGYSSVDKFLSYDFSTFNTDYNITDDNKPVLENYVREVYDNTKNIHQFMASDINKINSLLTTNTELNICIGRYYHNRKTIPKLTINRSVNIVNYFFIKSLIDSNPTTAETTAMPKIDFKMPENKIINKKLVIEI